jgi:hypothetical protein
MRSGAHSTLSSVVRSGLGGGGINSYQFMICTQHFLGLGQWPEILRSILLAMNDFVSLPSRKAGFQDTIS